MDTINIKVNYNGKIKLHGEYECMGPIAITWFKNVDLIIETEGETIVHNGDKDAYISPAPVDKNLQPVDGVDLKLMKNNHARYVIVDNKFAFKLPNNVQ